MYRIVVLSIFVLGSGSRTLPLEDHGLQIVDYRLRTTDHRPKPQCLPLIYVAHAGGGFLEGKDLLPGFRYPIANLFKEWDWD
ncbi:MAG: hypothetical protein C5B50_13345 [Verrucomicrobia bacterium]|nr:MAG: hypothetical protein C5B50_13345 [Verrucomicrobiota bacterium]